MDLTTRRGEDGLVTDQVGSILNGTDQMCRSGVLNGTGDDVTSGKNTNAFSIRNLVGAEDSDHVTDGTGSASEGKNYGTIHYVTFSALNNTH